MIRIFRATDNKSDSVKIPSGSSWATNRTDAEAYTDNPGFGGKHIVEAHIEPKNALDVRGRDAHDLSKLASALGRDAQEWRDDGLDTVFAVLENRSKIRKQLAEMNVDWIVYLDDYPANATTYRKM